MIKNCCNVNGDSNDQAENVEVREGGSIKQVRIFWITIGVDRDVDRID